MVQSLIRRILAWDGKEGAPGSGPDRYTCGTLHYTPAALAVLFGWLLWGDFTMCLMESLPGLLVMQLKDYNVSNQAIGFLMTTIFTVANTVLNPIISYSSDRTRTRWGRRRPFLMFATPFVTLFLILIPWAPQVTAALVKVSVIHKFLELFPWSPLVLVFGVLIALFQIFHMFIGSVYYYLIPDTVPEPFIGRFYGLFRVVGLVGGMLFYWFVYGKAHAHMRLVFAAFAVLYGVSFVLMCWKVREGDYPEIQEKHGHWFSPIQNYVVECFGTPRNWLIFLVYGTIMWPSAASQFALFFYRDQIGLTEAEVGRISAVSQGAMFLLAAPFGALVDRWGSQKALMVGLVAGIVASLSCFFLIHTRLMAFVLGFTQTIPVFLIFLALAKWTVDMYPRAQYGQYGSAGAMVGALGAAIFSPLVGRLVDHLGNEYRLCWLGYPIFYGVSLICCLALSRWAKRDAPETKSTPALPADALGQGSIKGNG
jgi:MFS family permease